MEPATALREQNAHSSGENDTSTSGVRAIDVRRDTAATLPGIRAIVVTPVSTDPTRGADLEQFQVEFAYDTQFFADLSGDVSRGGIIVTTYRDLPIGTPVDLDFELPSAVPVQARGEVRWVREDSAIARRGLAISFTQVAAPALQGIYEYCRVCPPLFVDLDG